MKATSLYRVLVLVTSLLLVLCQNGMAIEFQDSIDVARSKDTSNRPMVVSFGSPSCGWCRKMQVDTFDSDEIKAISDKYLWVKIDVDEQREVAASYRVEGLPRTLLLNAKGRVIGSAEGYLPAKRFIKFLDDSLAMPMVDASRVDELLQELVQVEDGEGIRKVVSDLVDILSKPNRLARHEILTAFKEHKVKARPVLLALMAEDRLAVRAAAAVGLKHCLGSELEFDPFASKESRETQLEAFRQALEGAGDATQADKPQ